MRPADPARPMDTLLVSTCNTLNLALPGRVFYPNQDAYTQAEFERKVDWLGGRLRALNADVLAVQEVWDEQALQTAIGRSGLRYDFVSVPGAENTGASHGAQGTPRVGIATRLRVESLRSIAEFPPALAVDVPGLGTHHRFERPPLLATLRMKHGQTVNVVTAHLKSKRPKFLLDALGQPLEDRDDRKVAALASLRSLIMRGVEAAALRCLVVDLLQRTDVPLVLLGDFNDTPDSVTTQLICATTEVAYDRSARDVALYNAYDVQGDAALKKDVAYSHIHQGMPAVLDQILVSEEFVPSARSGPNTGDVRRVDYFNDHLHEGRDRTRSDHGFVRALLRLPMPAPTPTRPTTSAVPPAA
ncbi:endonuclease/exonuclease/phosphatase family protein [Acidovorax sp. SUPP950]|uniref:endonuclease/exonuclease/phosphatase family protein n=1 Tax=Acidovorax sp. SUPP950 TaxID=511901 RepID=UPI0023BE2302|nr:endonuclease/exonuclease/phosphatase family protein [Acidovorax sp. SUPP950]GKS77586.1 endonuclease/exonuclease/phosphatase family protein [Acidovorax sp. SUPP950]